MKYFKYIFVCVVAAMSLTAQAVNPVEEADSLYAEAMSYKTGNGVERDLDKAADLFGRSAKLGHMAALRELGVLYLNTRQLMKALEVFDEGVAKGDTLSYFYAGKLLMEGRDIVADKQAAVGYLAKADSLGFAPASFYLSQCYAKGQGVKADSVKSRLYLQRAALEGMLVAQWEYAEAFLKGDGRSMAQALQWMDVAVENGSRNRFSRTYCSAGTDRDDDFYVYMSGKAALMEGDSVKALACADTLRARGWTEGLTLRWLAAGEKDDKLLSEAVSAGEPEAVVLEARRMTEGKNAKKAVKLLQPVADAHYAPALCLLGQLYYEGKGVKKNMAKAVECFSKVEKLGLLDIESARMLAECHRKGLGGLKADPDRALAIENNAKRGGMQVLEMVSGAEKEKQ